MAVVVSLELVLGVSLILNFLLILYGFTKFVKPRKKVKNQESVNFFGAIIIGYLGGFIGNAFTTSLFEISKGMTLPWFNKAAFIVSAICFVVIFYLLYNRFNESV